jgi:hypothetical protein
MNWKIQDKTQNKRPPLFCPQCEKCMYTREDVHSRELRGICMNCTDGRLSEYQIDVVRIVIDGDD